ncbi:MAG: hypothetical protein WEB04_03855 [Dehalococcoidia bacterium]
MARLLLLVTFATLVLVACIPRPEKQVDYLELPETVVVQMDVAGGFLFPVHDLPEFTLYGDGTLLLAVESDEHRIVQAHLSRGAIQDLLEFIEKTGFFNFSYEQPELPVTDVPTTYFYVNTREAANAVSAYALGMDAPEGDEWEQFRRLATIAAELEDVASRVETESYTPATGQLEIRPLAEDVIASEAWPFPQIDIVRAAPNGPATYDLDEQELIDMGLEHPTATMCWCPVEYGGGVFNVRYRPVLPYEANFPEFDAPTS